MSFTVLQEEKKLHPIYANVFETSHDKHRVIILAGPTASGKTKLSLSLAKIIGGEIISADSMQVYRGMDIGTAKASQEEQGNIAHHLIDICDISEPFNVVEFYHNAHRVLKEIIYRGGVPIVVGGTGFYIHTLLCGPPKGPPSDPEVRLDLEEKMNISGSKTLYDRLQVLDPEYAATITENDRQKIIRALEIIILTKKKVSDIPKPTIPISDKYDFRCWFLYFPKQELYPRIDKRCEKMLKSGFVEEVKDLEKKGLRDNPTASQAIGYRQCLEYLDSAQTKEDYQRFVLKFSQASRKYAKRQFTWFKKETLFRWLDLSNYDIEYVKEVILQDFEVGD